MGLHEKVQSVLDDKVDVSIRQHHTKEQHIDSFFSCLCLVSRLKKELSGRKPWDMYTIAPRIVSFQQNCSVAQSGMSLSTVTRIFATGCLPVSCLAKANLQCSRTRMSHNGSATNGNRHISRYASKERKQLIQ